MDSSSDGSFAWTDASDDTSDNENMAKTNVNTSQSEEESESGKTYKKKLQQRLFSGCADDGANNTEAHQSRKRKRSQKHSGDENIENPKRRRIKAEPESDVDIRKVNKKHKSSETIGQDLAHDPYDETYLDLKVNNEQNFVVPSLVKVKKSKKMNVSLSSSETNGQDLAHDSYDETYLDLKVNNEQDFVVPSLVKLKKGKKKNVSMSSSEKNGQDLAHDSYDETYLDLKVNNEQNFVDSSLVKLKKRKKNNVSMSSSSDTMNNGDVTESQEPLASYETKEINSQIHFEEEAVSLEEDENKYESRKNKKKKNKTKKNRDNSEGEHSMNYSVIGDGNDAEEMSEQSVESTQNHKSPEELGDNIAASSDAQESLDTTQNNNKTSKDEEKMQNGYVNGSPIKDHSMSDKNTNRRSKISERIRFEEDDSDVQTKNTKTPTEEKTNDNKLRYFVESSINMRPFPVKLPNASTLTDDDEVWVIRCPKDVNVEDFQDKNWTLDSKCKIKLDGQTYEGEVYDKKGNLTILSKDNEKIVIKNVTLTGCVTLRRRIPKAHIQESNSMINNQYNFIALPETKCRHPLFGFNYKKAIKVPSAVAERLRAADNIASTYKRKEKKEGRKSGSNQQVSWSTPKVEQAPVPELEQAGSTSKKKKKKKKRRDSEPADEEEAPTPHRHKRMKHDPESAEAWESAKAIEENLFNF